MFIPPALFFLLMMIMNSDVSFDDEEE